MVLFFTATLLISCVALVLLLALKQWELSTGRIVGSAWIRPQLSRYFHAMSVWIERIIPTLVRMYSKILWRAMLRKVHRITALVVMRAERILEKTLHTLRHTTDVRKGMGEASIFLREVSEHKRKLLRAQRSPVNVPKE